jgi:hypothetical protein
MAYFGYYWAEQQLKNGFFGKGLSLIGTEIYD